MSPRLTAALARHPVVVGLVAVVATMLLAVPLVASPPEGVASQEPGGPAFEARDVLDTRLSPDVAVEFVIVEARDGDLLDPTHLRTLHRRLERLRSDPVTGPLLVDGFDRDLEMPVEGTVAISDVVDAALAEVGGLADASDAAVTAAVGRVLDDAGDPTRLGLTRDTVESDDRWRSPAATLALRLDNDTLGGGSGGARIGGDTTVREQALREIRDVLRGGAPGDAVTRADAGELVAHAVAADANLTSEEQGQAAGPFIGITVFAILLLVGLMFRSAWTVAVVGTGIAALIIWLVGSTNLLGLAQDQILATIVPIALIAFGIDFAFHALGRVEEERAAGRPPRGALTVGLAGVGGALLLVLGSDAAAFLANTVSGIESIVQFGIAAALGLCAAFLLLGVVAPTVLAGLAAHGPLRAVGRRGRLAHLAAALLAAGLTTTTVLLTVYIAPGGGVIAFIVLALLGVALPAWLRSRRTGRGDTVERCLELGGSAHPAGLAGRLGAVVAAVARRPAVVLPAAAVVTAIALAAAVQIETRFDVRDFFAEETDFVQSLEALDRHVGDAGGEPVTIVVTADLTEPQIAARLAAEIDTLEHLDAATFATDPDGRTLVDGGVIDVLRFATTTPAARAQVQHITGVTLTDANGDGVPDTRAGIHAALATAAEHGLERDDGQVAIAPTELAGTVDHGPDDDASAVTLQLPASRELATITSAMNLLEPRLEALRTDLSTIDTDATVTLTGAPVVRKLTLDAISRALLLSLPIALLACLAVAGVAMRSLRYALISIVPILLVVPWLYGTMAAAGFAVNLVTATIGAISIGIGIDFAIHLVTRYREELHRHGNRDTAMHATGAGTGVALVASAGSSALGFAALAFAPMPLFATYGLLTAIMITMALVATLLVLPPLLRLATHDTASTTKDHEAASAVAAA